MKRVIVALALALSVVTLSLANVGCGETKPSGTPTKASPK